MQVLLDVESIQPDRILLLDSFFYVVVFHGTSIAQWRKEGYHLQEEHAGFKQLLEVTSCTLCMHVSARMALRYAPLACPICILQGLVYSDLDVPPGTANIDADTGLSICISCGH